MVILARDSDGKRRRTTRIKCTWIQNVYLTRTIDSIIDFF